LLSSTIEAPLEPSEARNDFRTSKKLSVKPRPGAFDSSSRPLLCILEIVRTHFGGRAGSEKKSKAAGMTISSFSDELK